MFFTRKKLKKEIEFLKQQVEALQHAKEITNEKGEQYVPADISKPKAGVFIPKKEKDRIDLEILKKQEEE